MSPPNPTSPATTQALHELLHAVVVALAYAHTPAATGCELTDVIAAWQRYHALTEQEINHG